MPSRVSGVRFRVGQGGILMDRLAGCGESGCPLRDRMIVRPFEVSVRRSPWQKTSSCC